MVPPRIKTSKISSVAYATDDSGSDANTARPTGLLSRSCRACASGIGGPTSQRFINAIRMTQHCTEYSRGGSREHELFTSFLRRLRQSCRRVNAHGAHPRVEEALACAPRNRRLREFGGVA